MQFQSSWFSRLCICAAGQEIAVVFSPQNYSSTQEDLDLRSKQVCRCLIQRTHKTGFSSFMSPQKIKRLWHRPFNFNVLGKKWGRLHGRSDKVFSARSLGVSRVERWSHWQQNWQSRGLKWQRQGWQMASHDIVWYNLSLLSSEALLFHANLMAAVGVVVSSCCHCPRLCHGRCCCMLLRFPSGLLKNQVRSPQVKICFKAPPWASPFERSFQKQAYFKCLSVPEQLQTNSVQRRPPSALRS